jgi:hypothetical protein
MAKKDTITLTRRGFVAGSSAGLIDRAAGLIGYVEQEFIPVSKDPFASLAEAVKLCDV